jgi:hypothetical protein
VTSEFLGDSEASLFSLDWIDSDAQELNLNVSKKISNVFCNGEWIIFMDISPLEWLPRRTIPSGWFFISESWKKLLF